MLGLDAGAALTVAGFVGRALHFADANAHRDAEGGAAALRAIGRRRAVGFDGQRLAEVVVGFPAVVAGFQRQRIVQAAVARALAGRFGHVVGAGDQAAHRPGQRRAHGDALRLGHAVELAAAIGGQQTDGVAFDPHRLPGQQVRPFAGDVAPARAGMAGVRTRDDRESAAIGRQQTGRGLIARGGAVLAHFSLAVQGLARCRPGNERQAAAAALETVVFGKAVLGRQQINVTSSNDVKVAVSQHGRTYDGGVAARKQRGRRTGETVTPLSFVFALAAGRFWSGDQATTGGAVNEGVGGEVHWPYP